MLWQVLLQVLLLENLSMILVAPLCSQKEWYPDLLMEEPLELPMLWNLLVNLHVKRNHRGLRSVQLHTWKLSSDSPEGRLFWWRCGVHYFGYHMFHGMLSWKRHYSVWGHCSTDFSSFFLFSFFFFRKGLKLTVLWLRAAGRPSVRFFLKLAEI